MADSNSARPPMSALGTKADIPGSDPTSGHDLVRSYPINLFHPDDEIGILPIFLSPLFTNLQKSHETLTELLGIE